jgi:hypothetical protein
MEQIEKFVEEIVLEKAKATNKDLMGNLVDLLLEKVKNLAAGVYDPDALKLLKAEHVKQLEAAKKKFSDTLNQVEADYKEQLAKQDQEAEDLRIQLKEAQEIASEALESFNASAGNASDSLETEVAGQKVKINFGVDFKGIYYSAEELVDNTEVLEKLVEMGSGSITLID